MPTLYVRDIPEHIYAQIRQVATAQGRSLSAYVVTVLQQAVEDEKLRRGRAKALANICRRRLALPVNAPDSVTMLRQIRGDHERATASLRGGCKCRVEAVFSTAWI
jgi:plasmid stability protein